MPHYKDQQGHVHFIDDVQHEGFLPANSNQITDDEAHSLLAPDNDALADAARARRDALITATDYLLMPDYPISAGQLAEVRAYRQALRDVPLQAGFPQAIDWPVPPTIATE